MAVSPEKERLTIFIPEEVSTQMRVWAARQRTTLSDAATEAFEFYLAAFQGPNDQPAAQSAADEN